ncbi:DUF6461 domain-containing protein [Goodfellowiella coeruleoviolacea]|uniref:Uncharacterized protein n=1 Tax=Goodfellowiella coeruleoviolacea TaxID=334858 RepID=A0AAE3GLN6_9PSEU|nr:DUF6461 domain-containing protein [Goodfellowiella coeruleoviolacea]MCP2169845.1 hypothetical protein [Goodfellowiella coeruleoviolacea]
MRELIKKYEWAEDPGLDLAMTVAVVAGATSDRVIGVYGGDPARPVGSLTFDEALVPEPDFGKYFQIQVLERDRHVVVLENNGWSGSVPEIARRASAGGGRFFGVYWSFNAIHLLSQAIDGKMTAYLELMTGCPSYDVHELVPPWMHGVGVTVEALRATCLAYLEQQTGVAFDRTWLDQKLPTYRVPDPDVMLANVANARRP